MKDLSILTSFPDEYPQIQTVSKLAKERKAEIYLVGGFLRDFLLERPCLDFDFAVDNNALGFARAFALRIKGSFVLLDKEHGCARVAKKSKGNLLTFDFADFRGQGIKQDLSHRDFTVNTLTFCLHKPGRSFKKGDKIMDFKKGYPDLKAKKVRMVCPKAFKEDPLRLMRAFSMQAMLGFKIEQKTALQIKKDKGLLVHVSYERIRDELFKILQSPGAAKNLGAMDRIKLLDRVIPQIDVMYNVKQGTYHHLDVWPHSLETVLQLEKLIEELKDDLNITGYLNQHIAGQRNRLGLVKLACLLHDIGKPDAKRKEQGRTLFHGHERIGKDIVRSIAKMIKISTRERFALQDMVLWHLRPGYLSNFKQPSKKAMFRYFRDTKEEAVSVALLSLADQRSTRGPLTTESDQRHHKKICMQIIKEYFNKKEEKPFVRLVNGDDLIRELKLKPSPVFKVILDKLDEDQAAGAVKTKSEALILAKKIAGKEMK